MKKLLEKVLKLMEEHEYNAMSLTEVEYCTTCKSHILSESGIKVNISDNKDSEKIKHVKAKIAQLEEELTKLKNALN